MANSSKNGQATAGEMPSTATAVNSVEPPVNRTREQDSAPALPAEPSPEGTKPRRRSTENFIELASTRSREKRIERPKEIEEDKKPEAATPAKPARGAEQEPSAPPPPDRPLDMTTVPEDVRRRFMQLGKKYHFPDGARAFTDHGKRLATPSENTEVIQSLIAIAQARGWDRVTVKGTDRFRKEAWLQARLAGLEVKGYKPSVVEQEHLIRTLARQVTERNPVREREGVVVVSEFGFPSDKRIADNGLRNPSSDVESFMRKLAEEKQERAKLITGRLLDHGPAPYFRDPKRAMSYFVKIETKHGDREIWGVDFERAFKESLSRPQIGDEVGLRSLGSQPVTVMAPRYDESGKLIGERKLNAYRNRWIVERREFLRERDAMANLVRDHTLAPARVVKSHPSLVGSYMALHAAELAARQIRDPQAQARFVEIFRNGLADSVERGEPLPMVKLRERAPDKSETRRPYAPDREQAQVR